MLRFSLNPWNFTKITNSDSCGINIDITLNRYVVGHTQELTATYSNCSMDMHLLN